MSLYKSLKTLYDGFPRQIGTPYRRDVMTFEELIRQINLYNGSERIYASILQYWSKNRNPVIDRIGFDLDKSDDILRDARKFYEWLWNKGYIATTVFSGNGFHFYLWCDGETNNRLSMMQFQKKVIKEVKISFDETVVGDVARIFGVPGTFNIRRNRYVIFLTEKDLFHKDGLEHIWKKAKHQYSEMELIGIQKVHLPSTPVTVEETLSNIEVKELNLDGDKFLETLPACVAYLLKHGPYNHAERGFIINYFVTRGFSEQVIASILKRYLPEDKYLHCVSDTKEVHNGKRGENQIRYILRKYKTDSRWLFNSCKNIRMRGWCVNPVCGKHPWDDSCRPEVMRC